MGSWSRLKPASLQLTRQCISMHLSSCPVNADVSSDALPSSCKLPSLCLSMSSCESASMSTSMSTRERCKLHHPNVSPAAALQPCFRRLLSSTSDPMQVAHWPPSKAQRGINSRTEGRLPGICSGFRGRGRKNSSPFQTELVLD